MKIFTILHKKNQKLSYALFLMILLLSSINSLKAVIYQVTNTNDSGLGSLRQAMLDANATPAIDNINFNISGVGPHTITLLSVLPQLSSPVHISGYALQAGAVQGTNGGRTIRIQINGGDLPPNNAGVFTFQTGASGSSLSGVAIYNTAFNVPALKINFGSSNIHIWGNYLGFMANGALPAVGNEIGGNIIEAIYNTSGGDIVPTSFSLTNVSIGVNGDGINDANEGNVLGNSANNAGVVNIQRFPVSNRIDVTNFKIAGNYIGFRPDGTSIAQITGSALSFWYVNGSNVVIGSNGDGTSDVLERNVIGNSSVYGIYMESTNNVDIAGNYIGTDVSGTLSRPTGIGVYSGKSSNLTYSDNIVIGFDDNKHTAAVAPNVRNVISGNNYRGVMFDTSVHASGGNTGRIQNVVVAGNYIGVDATGNVALANGQGTTDLLQGSGVTFRGVMNSRIGTDSDGDDDALERNVISGNANGVGIYFSSGTYASEGNVAAGNYIGVGANGTTALGNGHAGIFLLQNAGINNNRIGSNDDGLRDAEEANIIANNGTNASATLKSGVVFGKDATATGTAINNRISRNIFYNNAGLPIDLMIDDNTTGVTPNDGVTTAGMPNLLLDYPVITNYSITSATTLNVSGYVSTCNGNESTAGTTIAGNKTLQFYKVADDGNQNGAVTGGVCTRVTSHGEGVQYLGSITGVVNTFTNQTLTFVSGATFTSSDKLVAIAIDAAGNTSEFGATAIVADLAVTKTVNNPTAGIGTNVTFTITGSNLGPDPATNVVVNDVLPAGYSFVSATPSAGTSWAAPNWTIGNLANGASATLTIVATVNLTGSYANTATISGTSTQADLVSGNNSSTATVTPDSDGDGIIDIYDLDDDNDGILDSAECGGGAVYNYSGFGIRTVGTSPNFTANLIGFTGSNYTPTLISTNILSGVDANHLATDAARNRILFANSVAQGSLFAYQFSTNTVVNVGSGFLSSLNDASGGAAMYNGDYYIYDDTGAGTLATTTQGLWRVTFNGSGIASTLTRVAQPPFLGFDLGDMAISHSGMAYITSSGVLYKLDLSSLNLSTTAASTTWVSVGTTASASGTQLFFGANGDLIGSDNGNLILVNQNTAANMGTISTAASGYSWADLSEAPTVGFSCSTNTDGDPLPNHLDLDSDNDGCSDAIEGAENVLATHLNANTSINTALAAPNNGVGSTVNNLGVPNLVNSGGSADTGSATVGSVGQPIGSSQNALISTCICYEDPTLVAGQTYPVKHGITILGRAGKVSTGTTNTASDWPMLRNSAYTALESKTKGFVITRNSNPEGTITIPVVGMMVFDTDENSGAGCLKIYTGAGAGEGWKCFNTQGCP